MEFKKQQITRFTSCLAVISSIIWILWPSESWVADWKALLALVTTVVVWISLEYLNFTSEPPPKTKAKLKLDSARFLSVYEIISDHAIYSLKSQDLRGSFSDHDWKFLDNFFEQFITHDTNNFFDTELNEKFEKFKCNFRNFYYHFHEYIHHSNEIYWWKLREHRYPQNEYDRRLSEIDKLNEEATNLAEEWLLFKNLARNSLAEFI